MASNKQREKDEQFVDMHAPVGPQVAEAIRRIAGSDCPVLIAGERGVGKGLATELLHALSGRSRGEYKALSAASVDRTKLLAALPGAGTLVLLEAADMSLDLQEELVTRVRSASTAENNRLVFTSSQDLSVALLDGRIHEAFYYFIAAVSLQIPPLRHREAQLLALADFLLARYARLYDRPKPALGVEMRAFLLQHTWPGNLTELELSMKTCVAIGDPDFSLAALRAAAPGKRTLNGLNSQISLKAATRAASNRTERQLIAEVLRATNWNRKQTARDLNISYKTLLYKLKQNGMSDFQLPVKMECADEMD
ncbi:MAG: sigma 54-interacting transcriptional regulator [Acidobacteriaceae bacterium]